MHGHHLAKYLWHAISYSGTPLNGHPSKVNTHNNYNESPDCPLIHFNTERTLNSGHRATLYNWQLSRSQLYANKENREKQWARDTNVTLSAKGGPTTPGSRTYQRSDGQRGVTDAAVAKPGRVDDASSQKSGGSRSSNRQEDGVANKEDASVGETKP